MNLKQRIIDAQGREKVKLIREFKSLSPREKIKVLKEYQKLIKPKIPIESLNRIKEVLETDPTVNSLKAIEEDVRAVDEVYDSIADEPLVIEVVELFNNLISSNTTMDSLGENLFTLSVKALKTKERLDYENSVTLDALFTYEELEKIKIPPQPTEKQAKAGN